MTLRGYHLLLKKGYKMRLWSVHPKYLDKYGLIALWREGLLAQKALSGEAEGYRNNPQLLRFKSQDNPLKAIGSYLSFVASEGARLGYRFNHERFCTLTLIPGLCAFLRMKCLLKPLISEPS